MPLPACVSEPGYIDVLVGQVLEVVKAETNNLMIPANAEIVLEGEISLTEKAIEVPMGEYHGYQHHEGSMQPVFHIHAVTFRTNPILPICIADIPPEENHTIWGTIISAQLLEACQEAGLPVDMAWCSYEAATCWAILSIDPAALANMNTTADEFISKISDKVFGSHAGCLTPKLLLLSNDIDLTNINEVVRALATRCHPKFEHYSLPEVREFPMVPYLNPEDTKHGAGGKVIINCMFPEQFQGKMRASTASFKHSYSEELINLVLARWPDYGYAEGL